MQEDKILDIFFHPLALVTQHHTSLHFHHQDFSSPHLPVRPHIYHDIFYVQLSLIIELFEFSIIIKIKLTDHGILDTVKHQSRNGGRRVPS